MMRIVIGLLLSLLALSASAHKPSDAYLTLDVQPDRVAIRWDIALRDLDAAFDLDADGNRDLTWGELRARFDDIDRHVLAHLKLDEGRCVPAVQGHAIDRHSDGAYLVLTLSAPCAARDALRIRYDLFAGFDPTHRGILRIGAHGAPPRLIVLDPGHEPVTVDLGDAAGSGDGPFAHGFFVAGVHHILVGYDHVLFVICLLLPAVLRRTATGWQRVPDWRSAARPVLITVTAFTIAHSLTLALAALRVIDLPTRVIEPAIAATIVLTALGNVRPTRFRDSAAMPFVFGLVHGFGFAEVLRELALPPAAFAWALLRFNLGVEAGQLVVVAVALAVLLPLGRWSGYRRAVLVPVSLLAAFLALAWFAERVFDVRWLPI